MATIDDLKKARIAKLEKLRELGIDPYPPVVRREHTLQQARGMEERAVAVAGRVVRMRGHGKLVFWDIVDESGKMQIMLKADTCKPEAFRLVPYIDIADFVAVQGLVGATKSGEISVVAEDFQIITKALLPLPDQWHGLKDVEERYRKRYLDTILNPEVKRRLEMRSQIIDAVRDFLTDRGFLEVETPTLQPVYGGGFARPFSTHHNELDTDLYLRISDEMYLKRMIVGGFEKVYEITKVFRNEGIDLDHNPEFTMFEAQIAYEDYAYGMDIIEEIFEYTAKRVLGTTKMTYQGRELDVKRPWTRYKVVEAVKEYAGVDPLEWKSSDDAKKAIRKMDIKPEKLAELEKIRTIGECIAFAFEEMVEEKLIQPTIIYDYPIEVSPLAKKCSDPRFTQRFEYFAFGSELGNNYTELNDPVDLRRRFVEEKKREEAGFEEAHQTDYDYLTAIEHGFPPTCGLSIGIDRFVMLLTNARSIKEVIPFPTLRPEAAQKLKRPTVSASGAADVQLRSDFQRTYPSASVGYAIIHGVTIRKSDSGLEKEKDAVLAQYADLTMEKIEAFPEIRSYRNMYKSMGVDLHSRRPSPEALLRRISEGKKLYTVNTCVDAYNVVVMKHRVSLGAFDLDRMELPIALHIAKGGETIDLLGVKDTTTIAKGEVFYADRKGPFNLDYNWRDAERTKITEQTKNIILNVDGVYEVDEKAVARSLREAIKLITKYCGGEVVHAGIAKADGTVIPLNTAIQATGIPMSDSLPDEKSKRFIAILRKDIDPGKLMNALGHMTAGLAGGYGKGNEMSFLEYRDKDEGVHPNISHFGFIVLKADNANQIRTVRKEAQKRGIMFTDFTSTMTVGTSMEQVQATRDTKEEDLDYYGICFFGDTDELREFTKKFSLFK